MSIQKRSFFNASPFLLILALVKIYDSVKSCKMMGFLVKKSFKTFYSLRILVLMKKSA